VASRHGFVGNVGFATIIYLTALGEAMNVGARHCRTVRRSNTAYSRFAEVSILLR
jgi:hypothetical protein